MAQESAPVLIKRALKRQCPLCGRGQIFRSHFAMNRTCPNCHVVFWRHPGESLGAMYLDYAVAGGSFLATWAALAWLTPLSDLATGVILSAVVVASLLVGFPFTRSFWTMLVYLSGGIERPRMQVIRGRGGKSASRVTGRGAR